MKICIPILSFTKAGGMKVLAQLANRSKKLGHEVKFFCADPASSSYYEVDVPIEYAKYYSRKKNKEMDPSLLKKIYAIYSFLKVNSKNFDAIIANYYLTAYPVFMGSIATNIYYIQAYEPEFSNEIRNYLRRYSSKFIAWFSYFLPLTQVVNSNLYINYKNIRSSTVLVPGLDLEIFKDIARSKNEVLTIGCIGRPEAWKGSQDVADAVNIINEKNIPIKFKVAFNSVSHKNYELCHPEGSEGLAEFYRSVDVMVAPGHIQLGAIHYPVIEAMACGVPVITTGYYPANNNNSYIVPIKSPESIANIILNMSDQDSKIKIQQALMDIKEFSWDSVVEKFIDIIEKKRMGE